MKLNATISSIEQTFSMPGSRYNLDRRHGKNERQNYLLEYKFINYKTPFKVDEDSERTSLNLLCLNGPCQVFIVAVTSFHLPKSYVPVLPQKVQHYHNL